MTQDITNSVQRFFATVDAGEWEATQALMTNPFHLDYSSYGAGPAADLDPADILSGWRTVLPGFDATQHQLSPLDITVDGDRAVVRASVIATHWIADAEGGETWTVHGDYALTLVQDQGWKLAGNVFTYKFQTGNGALPALAQQRVAGA